MCIDDAYRVERVLARGAGGVTELVTLDGSGPFVRKRIPSKLARRGVWATLSECDCARLPHVDATYEMPDEFVVVCDYVPGDNIEQIVSANGPLAEKEAVQLVLQLCEAVGALHGHGIVHRDVSPTNVIVAADGAHLIDLGIARFRVEGATRDTTQLGTYGFASPEQYGFAQTDARSDVYSLGRVLGYLLTGVSPAEAEKYETALANVSLVSTGMRAAVERATAMEPSARYQSAEELSAAIGGEGLAGREGGVGDVDTPGAQVPGQASPTGTDERLVDYRRALTPAKLIVLLVTLVALAAFVILGGDARDYGDDSATSAGTSATGGVAATSDDPSASHGETATLDVPELSVVESGWSADEQGFVHYGVALRNPGDVIVRYPAFTVTGRDSSGEVLFSQEQVLSCVGPGETVFWGGLAGESGHVPATVDFTPSQVGEHQLLPGSEAVPSFSVSGVRAVEGTSGALTFTGMVTTEVDDGSSDYGSGVAVAVLLRDESGAITFGSTGFASRPSVGEATSFEVDMYGFPDYMTFEAHAIAW